MLKLSLIVLFVMSLATLAMAASQMPLAPETPTSVTVADLGI